MSYSRVECLERPHARPRRSGSAKRALLERYQLYQAKPSAIAGAVAETTPQ
jgi:hypothetical protein